MDRSEPIDVDKLSDSNLPVPVQDFIMNQGPDFDEGGWWAEGATDMYKWIISGGNYKTDK